MSNSPILWGANNTANNLQGSEQLSDGQILKDNGPYNYIRNSTFDSSITLPSGPTLFNTTLTSGLPTGTITAGASSLTLSQDTATPLIGTGSLQMNATAWVSGQGFYLPAFTVEPAHLGKVLTWSFYYNANFGGSNIQWGGTITNQTLMVYIYDVTASAWLQPTGFLGANQNSGTGFVSGTFQSSVVAGQQYRLCVMASQNTGGPVVIDYDQFYLGPQTSPVGAAMTDWVSYTPTGSWTTNTTYSGKWRRVGDTMEAQAAIALTGAPSATSLFLNLPAGYSIDTTKFSGTVRAPIGFGQGTAGGLGYTFQVDDPAFSTTQVEPTYQNTLTGAVTSINASNPVTWASGNTLNFTYRVPIAGWSSNVQMSSDTDTRVISFTGTQTSQAVTANVTNIAFIASVDRAGAWNGTQFIVPVVGDYVVSASGLMSATSAIKVWKNGTLFAPFGTTSGAVYGGGSLLVAGCVAGDVLSVRADTSVTITQGQCGIYRLSGPSVIAATESVSLSAVNTSGQSIPNASPTTITGWTKQWDSHNAFSVSGVYTIPVSGKFRASLQVQVPSGFTASTGVLNPLIVQAGSVSYTAQGTVTYPSLTTSDFSAAINKTFNCVAGDTLTLQVFQNNGAARSLWSADASKVFVSIERVGN